MEDWWKSSVVYQIYPISFYDSNGDGMGDLNGITQKLDYLVDLGVDILWISPYFKSPYIDNGYDISDYRDIDARFGTLKDWENLINAMHERDLKLIMDLVVNHCSDQHYWFQQAIKSKDNPYRDYFIWKDAKKDGTPPNNWTAHFGGSAWEWHEGTRQYYLHLFTKEQPDLNWENPKLRQEIYDIMRYWLDKGVDGFRLDAMHAYAKEKGLPDGDENDALCGGEHYANIPRNHEYLQEMYEEVLKHYDVFTVGETDAVTVEDAQLYSDAERNEVSSVFYFEHVNIECDYESRWLAKKGYPIKAFKDCLCKWQIGLMDKGWNSLYLSNHDQPRHVSRFGDDGIHHDKSAKMLATVIHMQKGTPYIYQGEEIGMTNTNFESIKDVRDIESLNAFEDYISRDILSEKEMLEAIGRKGRDNSRTPMQWNSKKYAGFSEAEPWIKVNPNYADINVEKQIGEDESILSYYKKLIRLRKEHDAIVHGAFTPYYEESEDIFCYSRVYKRDNILVIANMTDNETAFVLPEIYADRQYDVLIENYKDTVFNSTELNTLKPYETKVLVII